MKRGCVLAPPALRHCPVTARRVLLQLPLSCLHLDSAARSTCVKTSPVVPHVTCHAHAMHNQAAMHPGADHSVCQPATAQRMRPFTRAVVVACPRGGQDREATRTAVTTGVEESAQYAMKAMAYAAKLREDSRAEKERLAQEKRLSFNQKVRRQESLSAYGCQGLLPPVTITRES